MNCTAELGECELPEHTPELVSEFRFIPNQTEAMEFDIFQRWKEYRYLSSPLSCSELPVYFVWCVFLQTLLANYCMLSATQCTSRLIGRGSVNDQKATALGCSLSSVLFTPVSQGPVCHLFFSEKCKPCWVFVFVFFVFAF